MQPAQPVTQTGMEVRLSLAFTQSACEAGAKHKAFYEAGSCQEMSSG